MASGMWKRQQGNGAFGEDDEYNGDYDDYDGYDSWWWSPVRCTTPSTQTALPPMSCLVLTCSRTPQAGMAVRYAIVAILFGSILLFLIGGYWSTQRRIRRGQEPRPLFRWMVRRRQAYYYHNAHHHPNPYYRQQYPSHHRAHYSDPNSQGYGMDGYPAPPPPYSNGEMPPPVYQPPQGASKAMPDQSMREPEGAAGGHGEASSSAGVEQPPPVATGARQ